MQNVGINLTKEQVASIKLKLEKLTVPNSICFKNRYWDPFVLDIIYTNYKESVPKHPHEYGAKTQLDRMLKFLRDTPETAHMYEKNIPTRLQKGSGRGLLCSLCMQWAKEKSLKVKYSDGDLANEIENRIEILQNTVSYKVPLLLKPIFDIKDSDSSFISCLQTGAYNNTEDIPRLCRQCHQLKGSQICRLII